MSLVAANKRDYLGWLRVLGACGVLSEQYAANKREMRRIIRTVHYG
jgi:hypothetical protein